MHAGAFNRLPPTQKDLRNHSSPSHGDKGATGSREALSSMENPVNHTATGTENTPSAICIAPRKRHPIST